MADVAAVQQQNGEVAADGQQEQQQPPAPRESFLSIAKSLIVRAMIIYFITSMFRRPQQPASSPGPGFKGALPSSNLYENGTSMDLYVYISEDSSSPNFADESQFLWTQTNLNYGDWYEGPNGDSTFTYEGKIPLSASVQNNGTIYLHAYVVRQGDSPDSKAQNYNARSTIHQVKQLNKYKKKKYSKTQNLLTGETEQSIQDQNKTEKVEIISHWHPNLTINVVYDYTQWTRGAVPQPLDEFIEFVDEYYKPILYFNDYWNLAKDYQPINDSFSELPLMLTFQPLSMMKWQLYAAQGLRNKWASGGGVTSILYGDQANESDEEQDTLKETMLETNPVLLGLTIVISLVHSVFEFLAFKNDIQFWKNRESLEGLSVRSVFFNVFQSVIVLLYVLDNETNTVIKISCAIGLAIEIWKIKKVVDVKLDRTQTFFGLPRIVFAEKTSYVASQTKEYDMMAFKYLSWLLYPLLIGYAIYSLVYQEHKGWYSWVLSMLYGFLLTFGFIMMTPQLFINYKMKSVAHLPWRMLTYKALNTFIDDIFAFVIKMPTLYRLGCFRDDIVFFIFLYQRWIYRVDPHRVNEFGFSQTMLEERKNEAINAAKPEDSETTQTPLAVKKNE
uniref:EOG090X032C n=1 Tax=Lynceus sp. MCZ IZ 141354 TaxID=1930659 RepID=A0A9N6WUD1_9CRUS|nr:EOG090X032C [Lynceus sp. MCZ IZ 141354]